MTFVWRKQLHAMLENLEQQHDYSFTREAMGIVGPGN